MIFFFLANEYEGYQNKDIPICSSLLFVVIHSLVLASLHQVPKVWLGP